MHGSVNEFAAPITTARGCWTSAAAIHRQLCASIWANRNDGRAHRIEFHWRHGRIVQRCASTLVQCRCRFADHRHGSIWCDRRADLRHQSNRDRVLGNSIRCNGSSRRGSTSACLHRSWRYNGVAHPDTAVAKEKEGHLQPQCGKSGPRRHRGHHAVTG